MSVITVETQAELDAVLDDPDVTEYDEIEIQADEALVLNGVRRGDITARESTRVTVYNCAAIGAADTASVRAYSSEVRAGSRAFIEAHGDSHVWAYRSSTVWAYGHTVVEAVGNDVDVFAYGRSNVEADNMATVRAYENATVLALNASTVYAYDTTTVHAWGSSTVVATPGVAVHRHSASTKITGGIIIDHVRDLGGRTAHGNRCVKVDVDRWLAQNTVAVAGTQAVLYMAVTSQLIGPTLDGRPVEWAPNHVIQLGALLYPTPGHALHKGPWGTHTRVLECRADVATLVPVLGKGSPCEAPTVRVVREVDATGRPVEDGGTR